MSKPPGNIFSRSSMKSCGNTPAPSSAKTAIKNVASAIDDITRSEASQFCGSSVGCGRTPSRARAAHALETPRDRLGVAIDVCADLKNRGLSVPAGQARQIRLRHDHRDLDRLPGQALVTLDQADLLGVRGKVVVVENEFAHGATLAARVRCAIRPHTSR